MEKKHIQFIICIFFLKSLYFLKFWKILCWKYTDYSQYISLELSSEIYLSKIIIGVAFLHHT